MTSRREKRPRLRLACCLCDRPIAADVYPLDDEWARRYPEMRGRLACHRCALGDRYGWVCLVRGGAFVPGHIASGVIGPDGRDVDHWSHVGAPHTPAAAVLRFPQYAIAQGGEDYARWLITSRRGVASDVRARLAEYLPG